MDMRHTPFFFVIFAGLNINEIIAVYYDSLNLMINSNNKLQQHNTSNYYYYIIKQHECTWVWTIDTQKYGFVNLYYLFIAP